MGTLHINGLLTETTRGKPAPDYAVEFRSTVKVRFEKSGIPLEADLEGPRTGPSIVIEHRTFTGPSDTDQTDTTGQFTFERNLSLVENAITAEIDLLNEIPGITATGDIIEYRVTVMIQNRSGTTLVSQTQSSPSPFFNFNLQVPRRRIIILDIDGLRWDVFYRHLKRVRDAGASLDRTYRFTPHSGATNSTVIGDGADLRSALSYLCFNDGMGRVDVRFARASYPTYTFPSHATMFTGVWPNRHGITGHEFVVRDTVDEWDPHDWDSLPRGPAVQGYCTHADSSSEAILDYLWGGIDEVDDEHCTDRNRGLVSDQLEPTLYHHIRGEGLRSTVIHNFFHGASRPWENEGKDDWWRITVAEAKTMKDICSGDDPDEYEEIDSAALVKAQLLLDYKPHTTLPIVGNVYNRYDLLVNKLSGERSPLGQIFGSPNPEGPPDIITIYLASIDNASHVDGIANQETYLAWLDHRLANFIELYKASYPFEFNNTVFALLSDHGHVNLLHPEPGEDVPENNTLTVKEELVRIAFDDDKLAQLKMQARSPYFSYDWLVNQAISGRFEAFAQAMNLYVYIREITENPEPIEVARRLLQLTMKTETIGAFVRDRDANVYRFLARGDDAFVDLGSNRCREVLSDHLDVPGPLEDTDIENTSLSSQAVDSETDLRIRLQDTHGEGFDLLNIVERIAGLGPRGSLDARRSPDIILIAPVKQSFSGGASTHGSFAYPVTRIPMIFFGPGVEATEEISEADMVDFAPTILSLLGYTATEMSEFNMDGSPLVDYKGMPIRTTFPGPVEISEPPKVDLPSRAVPHDELNISVGLQVDSTQQVEVGFLNENPSLPMAVMLELHEVNAQKPEFLDEGVFLHRLSGAKLEDILERDDLRWLINDIEVCVGHSHAIKWKLKNLPRNKKESYAVVRAELDKVSKILHLPRIIAIQHLKLTVPRVPIWLLELADAASNLAAPYWIDQTDKGDKPATGVRTKKKVNGRTRPRTKLPLGADAPQPIRQVLLEAVSFHQLVEAVTAQIDGTAVLSAQIKIDEALSAVAPRRLAIKRQWEEGRERLVCAWRLVEQAGRSASFSEQAYNSAVEAMNAISGNLPRLQAIAVQEAASLLRNHPGRLIPGNSNAEQLQIARASIERLLNEKEIIRILYFQGP